MIKISVNQLAIALAGALVFGPALAGENDVDAAGDDCEHFCQEVFAQQGEWTLRLFDGKRTVATIETGVSSGIPIEEAKDSRETGFRIPDAPADSAGAVFESGFYDGIKDGDRGTFYTTIIATYSDSVLVDVDAFYGFVPSALGNGGSSDQD